MGHAMTRIGSGLALAGMLAAGCATPEVASAPVPAAPQDVRVAEMSPKVVALIADAVAARLAASLPAPLPAPLPTGAPTFLQGAAAPPVRVVRTRTAPIAALPAAPLTDAERETAAQSVGLALDWFARHQSESGEWSPAGFSARCQGDRCGGPGEANYTVGVTGLAVLCFLGAGETHQSGPHTENVKLGLRYLIGNQDSEGCIGPRTSQHYMYNHAYGALAVVEAYGMTQSAWLKTPAQQAVNFILQARNPYLGWRYGVRDGDNDTSTTGLMVTVLKSAQLSGLEVDDQAFTGALMWFDKMTEPEFGKVGYQQRGGPTARTQDAMVRFPADRSEAMTAVATAARVFAGADASKDEWVRKGADLLAARPPVWNEAVGSVDLYYWYWGTLAMFQKGGAQWDAWRTHLVRALTSHQRREVARDDRGSWDPVDPWSAEGGRIYSTAIACLASEIAARSLK